jgi:HlyD family secretion protein
MKKKKSKLVWIILALFIVLVGIIYLYLKQGTQVQANATGTTTKEVEVSTQTITKTLTSSGEISTALTETLELNTYRYFKEIYVEQNDAIKRGEPILKYTNGTYLYAPYNCVVTGINIPESGEICRSSNGITVKSTEELIMTLNIDESEIKEVAVGQEVTINVSALEDKTYTGTIQKINQIGSYASNGSSFSATVKFNNDDNIKLGMSASCEVVLEKVENVLAVPIEAIQTQSGKKYVVVVNSDGTTQNKEVQTGLSNDAYVEIKSGLTGEETIQMIQTTTTTNSSFRGMQGNFQIPSMGGQQTMPGGVRPNSNNRP